MPLPELAIDVGVLDFVGRRLSGHSTTTQSGAHTMNVLNGFPSFPQTKGRRTGHLQAVTQTVAELASELFLTSHELK
jgi:hypothetical protein